VLPLRDNVPTRAFPVVTVGLIAANALVWFWELGATERQVDRYAYYPCDIQGPCLGAPSHISWSGSAFSSMFMHGSWTHILGNMLFLWIFGNNVEDALGRVRFLVFYLAGGVAATVVQSFVTVVYGTARDADVPNLGASGAIAAVLGAYFLLVPRARVLTFVLPFFFFEIPAVIFLGLWFLFQLVAGGYSFVQPESGGGVAFFAHLGGFAFGVATIKAFTAGRPGPLRPSY
jgi:membrane associated rhomboid family serine protease